ncbi:hypothetical protein Q7C36_014910 [Tachysurus vachellii]|uniref:Uncharacterized protein n=1 Tax=Tachysurus vachellii TaxID=175792 RepID=A0AA88SEJ6_TACVA|nr:hypothetical protein Q7C36_014910 [Tachysurus vachellii]
MSARLPLGKEPETEGKIFCRPGGVASPRFGWPPAKRTGRSQEVEWTKSGRRIQRRRNGTDRSGAEKGARQARTLISGLKVGKPLKMCANTVYCQL